MTANASLAPIQYETLVAEFRDGLLNASRCHTASQDFLEIWVPDEDPVRGILNMAESAEAVGRPDIAVRVGLDTLPTERHGELLGLLSALGHASIDAGADGGGVVVTVSALGVGSALRRVHHSLRQGMHRRLAAIDHEGALEEAEGLVRVAVVDGSAELIVLIDPDTHLIEKARHDRGRGPVERALLDVFCAVIENTPVDDAADHGPINAMAALRDGDAARPVAGILHPVNADPAFVPLSRMAHHLRDAYRERSGMADRRNEFDPPPDARWLALTDAEREERLAAGIIAFLDGIGRSRDSISLLRLDDDLNGRPVRAVVSFAAAVTAGEKPDLMRALERHVKRSVEGRVQLYHEQRKDENAIRRL